MYDLNEIRRRISLVGLAEEAGARFKNENHLASRCPLPRHAGDRTSLAFTIYDNCNRWKCFSSCPSDANGGDLFAFYMAWKGITFGEAVTELAGRTGLADHNIPVTEKTTCLPAKPSPLAKPAEIWQKRAEQYVAYGEQVLAYQDGSGARDYLEKERGLWPETWRAFRLGYNPRNLYDSPERWGLEGRKVWLPRGIVIPGLRECAPWYVKVRRTLPGDLLGQYIGQWNEKDGLPNGKFGGPRDNKIVLFGQQHFARAPVLLLTEGEWDAMLAWQWCGDFCDVSTLGGAQAHFDILDLAVLIRYQVVLAVHDVDSAGDKGRQYITSLQAQTGRLKSVPPPAVNRELAHDLTDYWKAGGNLRSWAAGYVASAMDETLELVSVCPSNPTIERWRRIAAWARQETGFKLP